MQQTESPSTLEETMGDSTQGRKTTLDKGISGREQISSSKYLLPWVYIGQ